MNEFVVIKAVDYVPDAKNTKINPIQGFDISIPVQEAHEAGKACLLMVELHAEMYRWLIEMDGMTYDQLSKTMVGLNNPILDLFDVVQRNKTWQGVVLRFYYGNSMIMGKPAASGWLNHIAHRIVQNFEAYYPTKTIIIETSRNYINATAGNGGSMVDWLGAKKANGEPAWYTACGLDEYIEGLQLWRRPGSSGEGEIRWMYPRKAWDLLGFTPQDNSEDPQEPPQPPPAQTLEQRVERLEKILDGIKTVINS